MGPQCTSFNSFTLHSYIHLWWLVTWRATRTPHLEKRNNNKQTSDSNPDEEPEVTMHCCIVGTLTAGVRVRCWAWRTLRWSQSSCRNESESWPTTSALRGSFDLSIYRAECCAWTEVCTKLVGLVRAWSRLMEDPEKREFLGMGHFGLIDDDDIMRWMRKNTFGEVEVKNYFQIMMMMMMMMMTTMTLLNVTSLVGAKTRSRRKIAFFTSNR